MGRARGYGPSSGIVTKVCLSTTTAVDLSSCHGTIRVAQGSDLSRWVNKLRSVMQPPKCLAAIEISAIERLNVVYQKRREAVKNIKKFWPTVLDEHAELEPHLQYREDLQALSHLTDFWLERNPKEPRAFTAEFVSNSTGTRLRKRGITDFRTLVPTLHSTSRRIPTSLTRCSRRSSNTSLWSRKESFPAP